jgi:5-methylcytosine-specific restriction enzyme subunit McrC
VGINQRYGPALRLAERILRASSIDAPLGPFAASAFIFDMNRVFEDFVTAVLTETMAGFGGTLRPQVQDRSLDLDGVLPLRPDLTWWVDEDCCALIDAKYKAIERGQMRNGDAYQMLAYCIAYGLPRGFLVYARDSGTDPRIHRIRQSGHEIVVAALDVEQRPVDLLADVRTLATEIAATSR